MRCFSENLTQFLYWYFILLFQLLFLYFFILQFALFFLKEHNHCPFEYVVCRTRTPSFVLNLYVRLCPWRSWCPLQMEWKGPLVVWLSDCSSIPCETRRLIVFIRSRVEVRPCYIGSSPLLCKKIVMWRCQCFSLTQSVSLQSFLRFFVLRKSGMVIWNYVSLKFHWCFFKRGERVRHTWLFRQLWENLLVSQFPP